MKKVIDGTVVSFSELPTVTDWDRVRKVGVLSFLTFLLLTHRICQYHKLDKEAKEKGDRVRAFIDSIAISSVAMKSVMQ